MTAPIVTLGKPDEIDRLIASLSALGMVGRVELLRAVRAGVIAMMEVDRLGVPPQRVLKDSRRPMLVVIGDDDYSSTGPTGWTALPRLLRWARSAMVHATGADVPSYQAVISGTLAARRFLLVETSTACAADWRAAFEPHGIPVLALLPPSGGHPVTPAREDVS